MVVECHLFGEGIVVWCCRLFLFAGCPFLLLRLEEHRWLFHDDSCGIGIEINIRIVREQASAANILSGSVDLNSAELGIKGSDFVISGMMEIFNFLNRFGQCPVRPAYTYHDFQSHSFGTDESDAGVGTLFCQCEDACQCFLCLMVDVYHDVSQILDESCV